MKTYRSSSSEETKKIGERFAAEILKLGPRTAGAAVFSLTGNLGAGKTTFIQGFLRKLGLSRAPSPTFVLVRRTPLRKKKFKNVFHVDAYRVTKPEEFLKIDFDKTLADPENIVLIEWGEQLEKILPRHTRKIRFLHGAAHTLRRIRG